MGFNSAFKGLKGPRVAEYVARSLSLGGTDEYRLSESTVLRNDGYERSLKIMRLMCNSHACD